MKVCINSGLHWFNNNNNFEFEIKTQICLTKRQTVIPVAYIIFEVIKI